MSHRQRDDDNDQEGIDDSRCRLLVRLPTDVDAAFLDLLKSLARSDRLGGVVVGKAGVDGKILHALHAVPTAVLSLETGATKAGFDGVVVSDVDLDIGGLREDWGADAVVVAAVDISQDRAMQAGEDGADVLLFGDLDRHGQAGLVDCVTWAAGLFVLPVAAAAGPDWEPLVAAGADFLLVDGSSSVFLAAGDSDALSAQIDAAEALRPDTLS